MLDLLAAAVPVFLASAVECAEAWTVVLAVGLTRGWRAPLLGVVLAVSVLGALVAAFGTSVVERIDEDLFEVVVGTLLLAFGLRWMRKAVLRRAGRIPLRDEDAAFDREVDALRPDRSRPGFDWVGFALATKTMLVEGLEVAFLVVGLGATAAGGYPLATAAAAAAFVAVGAVGLLVRGPLSRVPENTIKTVVSVLVAGIGTYWVPSGLGLDWPAGSWALLYLYAAWAGVVVVATAALRRPTVAATRA